MDKVELFKNKEVLKLSEEAQERACREIRKLPEYQRMVEDQRLIESMKKF